MNIKDYVLYVTDLGGMFYIFSRPPSLLIHLLQILSINLSDICAYTYVTEASIDVFLVRLTLPHLPSYFPSSQVQMYS